MLNHQVKSEVSNSVSVWWCGHCTARRALVPLFAHCQQIHKNVQHNLAWNQCFQPPLPPAAGCLQHFMWFPHYLFFDVTFRHFDIFCNEGIFILYEHWALGTSVLLALYTQNILWHVDVVTLWKQKYIWECNHNFWHYWFIFGILFTLNLFLLICHHTWWIE